MQSKNHTNHSTILFVFLSYLIAWAIWIPWMIVNRNNLSLVEARWVVYVGTFAPSVAAALVWVFTGHRAVLIKKLRSIWQVPNWRMLLKIYYGFPLLVFGGLIFIDLILKRSFIGWDIVGGNLLSILKLPITSIVVALLFAGPLGEELGWRGFLLPRLLEKFSQLKSSIIAGIIWSFWHLPLFWFDSWRNGIDFWLYIPIYTAAITLISIILTSIYIRSKNSLFSVIIFHAIFNYSVSRYANVFDGLSNYEYIFSLIVIFALIILFDKRLVLKKRIGDYEF